MSNSKCRKINVRALCLLILCCFDIHNLIRIFHQLIEKQCHCKNERGPMKYFSIQPLTMKCLLLLPLMPFTIHGTRSKNIARVQNCPDVAILYSLFGLCLLSFCLFVFFPYVFMSFYIFVFLSFFCRFCCFCLFLIFFVFLFLFLFLLLSFFWTSC